MKIFSVLIVFFGLLTISACQPGSFVSNVLGNNMVLQRAPQSAVLWGWTNKANSKITVKFNSETLNTQSVNNAWSIQLTPTAAGGPYSIFIQSDDGESAVLSNVLFGDVYICSGQSNMQFTISQGFNATEVIADANNYPNIRIFTVGQTTVSNTSLEQLAKIEQPWSVGSATSVGGANWAYISAVCWFFGTNLYDQLQVPIGLVSTNWGGTYIQAWSSPIANSKCTSSKSENKFLEENSDFLFETDINEEYQKVHDFSEEPSYSVGLNPNQPSVLWNAMIFPFLPMRFSGATWYQAEANVGAETFYACAFPVMISDWRAHFGYTPEEFPFYFVQLAPYIVPNTGYGFELAQMRISQTSALSLPYVAMAVSADHGDTESPFGSIHPRDKSDIGYRLSLAARALSYGQSVQYEGPTFESFTSTQSGAVATVTISFTSGSVGSGLKLVAGVECPALVPYEQCGWPEVEASDGNWYNATITIQGPTAIFKSTIGSSNTVTGVRYLYNAWPVATLYNEEGLPAAPFIASN